MVKLDQMQLVCDIGKLLADKHGVGDVSARHMNAIIDAANRLCDEFNRADVIAPDGGGLAAWFGSDHVGMSSAYMARRLAPLAGLVCPPDRAGQVGVVICQHDLRKHVGQASRSK